ncbi:MAG TPA: hypothetical protein VEC57_05495 [Candidatus Limnocylindrales bacterium]|nr:hypothetical protein [Candidatus Limnocylindrales bacterium]
MLETTAALAVTGAMLATTIAALASTARLAAAATSLTSELFVERLLEHLVDRAALSAGSGPGLPHAIAEAEEERVVFQADLDGDGDVEPSGAETTALELMAAGGDLRIRHRLGKQRMTIVERGDATGRLRVVGRDGAASAPSAATMVELELRDGPGRKRRLWLFALPASLAP